MDDVCEGVSVAVCVGVSVAVKLGVLERDGVGVNVALDVGVILAVLVGVEVGVRVEESDALAEGDVDLVRRYPWLAVADTDCDPEYDSGKVGNGVWVVVIVGYELC